MRHRRLRLDAGESDDPLQGVANLFDLGIVFALGFLLSLLSYLGLPTLPQKPEDAVQLTRYQEATQDASGSGQRLGVAYRLENGDIVYVPE